MSKKDPTGFFFESYEGMDTFAPPTERGWVTFVTPSVRPSVCTYLNSTYIAIYCPLFIIYVWSMDKKVF